MEFSKKEVKIIILSGKAGSGKSYVANLIKEKRNCIILSYASYIKEIAKNVINWDGSEESKPRDFLQQFGDVIKSYDKDLLINRMIEDVNMYSYFYDLIIISDARFENEIIRIKESFSNVYVINIIGNENSLTDEQKNHITETSLDNFNGYDYKLLNDYNTTYKLEKILGDIYE